MSDEHAPADVAATEAAMAVASGTVVAFHYDLYDANAQRLESSRAGHPILCLIGQRGVLPALQDALLGREPGDEFSITIPHEKAYGRHYPQRRQRVSRKKIDGGRSKNFRVGEIVALRGEQGTSPVTVINVGRFNLDVDLNHPLAGIDLTFDMQIVSVREATAEEVSHGHAHGAGGHQH